jgi:hypothetical protein
MPSFMNGKRSRLIIIAAAGTLTLATAISAAAATLPAGFAASAADAHMLTQTVHLDTLSPAQRLVWFDTTRYGLAQRQTSYESAAAKAAVAKAAAQKAAAARAAAAKAAAAKAAAAKAAEQQAAQQQAPQQQATQQQAAQQQAAQQTTAPQPAASAPSGSPQQIAEQMLKHLREQPRLRRVRHPAGAARLEDGECRAGLAERRGNPDPLGPDLHPGHLRVALRRLVARGSGRLVLTRR